MSTHLSYAEAYMIFINYMSSKKNEKWERLVSRYKGNGVEQEFKKMYNKNPETSTYKYYMYFKDCT